MRDMPSTSDSAGSAARQRLAKLVRKRRVELGMNKIDVARAAETTITTYGKIEAGEPVRDVTYAKAERVLGWPLGTCKEILDGATDAATVETSQIPGRVIVTMPQGALEDDIKRAVQDVMVGGTDLPAPEIRRINAEVIELLRERGVLPEEG